MLLIQNGRVLDPYTGVDAPRDVLIGDDGVIAAVQPHIDTPAGCEVYDAAGLTVSPGFVDGHVHFRDPGQTQKEDVLTGAAAAAAGGYATVICMANTLPTCDTPQIIQYVTDKAKDCPVEVLQAGAVTKGLKGQELTDFDALTAAGAPCLTDDGINLTSAALCRTAMEQAAARDILLSFHEEEPSLVPSPGVNYGSAAAKQFGVPGAMAAAETAMIARDIAFGARYGRARGVPACFLRAVGCAHSRGQGARRACVRRGHAASPEPDRGRRTRARHLCAHEPRRCAARPTGRL